MNIKEALAKLDPSDDAYWTGDGMPRMDVLQKMTLTPDLSRTQVTNAAPDFTRASALEADAAVPGEDDNVEASPAPEQASKASKEVIEVQVDSDVMVEAEVPTGGSTIVEAPDTPEAPEIVTSAPEKPVSAPATKLEALQAALAIHTDAMNDADRVKKAALKAFYASSDQVNDLNRQIDAIMKADPHAATAGIRDYIKMQNQVRAERAGRARRFLGNSGAQPGDVAKALEVRSPLDKAMHGRKPARGSQRPSIRG